MFTFRYRAVFNNVPRYHKYKSILYQDTVYKLHYCLFLACNVCIDEFLRKKDDSNVHRSSEKRNIRPALRSILISRNTLITYTPYRNGTAALAHAQNMLPYAIRTYTTVVSIHKKKQDWGIKCTDCDATAPPPSSAFSSWKIRKLRARETVRFPSVCYMVYMETVVTVPEVRDILDEQTSNAQHIHRGKIRMAKRTDRRQSVFVCHIIRTVCLPKWKNRRLADVMYCVMYVSRSNLHKYSSAENIA